MRRIDRTDLPLDECPMAVALKEGRTLRGVEAIVVRPNGEERYVLANPHPFLDATGRTIGGINALLDITDRRRDEDIRQRLAAIVQSSDEAIISMDLNGVVRTWNGAAERPLRILGN